jgi:hypothetical protein
MKTFAVKFKMNDGAFIYIMEKLINSDSAENAINTYLSWFPDEEILGVRTLNYKDIGTFIAGLKPLKKEPR